MKKRAFIMIILGIIIIIFIVLSIRNKNLITAKYSNGQIITKINIKNPNNIQSTEFRYITHFLEQYKNIEPRMVKYSFDGYKETHIFNIDETMLQGKKDYILVQVFLNYNDGTTELIGETKVKNIKEKVYQDFVISPDFKNDLVYYRTKGFTAVFDSSDYDEEIIFYSNPNYEWSNITVGFHKDYALYNLKSYGLIPYDKAVEEGFEGFSIVDFYEKPEDDSLILVEYGMIDLFWAGLYPYDLEGNPVFYESKDGGLSLIDDNGELNEVSKAGIAKYQEMKQRIPKIRFIRNTD